MRMYYKLYTYQTVSERTSKDRVRFDADRAKYEKIKQKKTRW